jgi:HEAT repeat protein
MLNFLTHLHIDRLSFWIGFLAASLFWWVYGIIRGQLPRLRLSLQNQAATNRKRSNFALDERWRKLTLLKAQNMHLSAAMFPLDEILIPPRILASPLPIEPDGSLPMEDDSSLVISITPDWTELTACYSMRYTCLADALQNQVNVAVIGKPGIGKTVCLAQYASQLARRDPEVGALGDYLPIMLHVTDLNIPEKQPYSPVNIILSTVVPSAPTIIRSQLPKFLRNLFNNGQVILLLDGADELSQPELQTLSTFLSVLIKDFPQVHFVMTGSSDYLDGLLALGIVPLSLAGWNPLDKKHFIELWHQQWQQHIEPDTTHKEQSKPVDLQLVDDWLMGDTSIHSPFELTLQVWSAYQGDLQGPRNGDAIEAYLRRIIYNSKLRSAAENMAVQSILAGQSKIAASTAGGYFQEAEGALAGLMEHGLLVNRVNASYSFTHPILAAYLASCAIHEEEELTRLMAQPVWTGKDSIFTYLANQLDMTAIITARNQQETNDPLQRSLLSVARWLPEAPASETWRNQVLRSLVELLRNDNYPLALRSKAASALVASNDTSIPVIFRQFLLSSSAMIRQLGCLGCGALRDTKAITDLGGLLSDPSPWVRSAACMALVALGTNASMKIATEVLMYGDENLGRVAAEAFASQPPTGYEILRESSASTNLLVRRASVFGLVRTREPWAIEILEKMRIEDGQWVVRNAASQVLDTAKEANPYQPRQLPLPHETPWLVAFASKQGGGISPQQSIKEIVFSVLSSGTAEEKQAVLTYVSLINNPDSGLIGAIYKIFYTEDGPVREAACYALWLLSISGAELPSPVEFGFV